MKPVKLLLAIVVALIAGVAQAQTNAQKIVLWQYNLNQTVTPIYCAPGANIVTSYKVTAANSTTLTAVSGTPFANVSVGDMLVITDGVNGTRYRRAVTIRTSDTSVVISGAAVTIASGTIEGSGLSVKISCGTTAAFGAFSVSGFNKISVQVQITQQNNTGGISFHLQCRVSPDADWVQQYPALTPPAVGPTYSPAYTSTGQFTLGSQDAFGECRVGMLIVTNDDGNDLTTNAEQVTIILVGRK